jgi:Lrp/AsnC family transcriptional regulator, leucine-responsive regulatory protein
MSTEEINLDAIDLRLLDHLQRNAATSNQDLAAQMHISPPTCLRRIKRLQAAGLIERQVAILSADRLAPIIGHGLTAIVEVTLDEQAHAKQQAFEQRAVQDAAVQQCYRVSSGPDFVLIIHARDMPTFAQITQRLLTSDANVRNVKTYFSIHRAKFAPAVDLLIK